MLPPEPSDRPSPEALLEVARAEGRGRLKIFLGAAPGVGKTYAMLAAAQRARMDGRDVVVAVVETHGRRDTARLLDGLEVVPRKEIEYRGRVLAEMDLDAVLARRPALALVDELAHSNPEGARHPKRWMDVDELLDAGIDVWTTLNIQHVESLVDVVARITRVPVRETIPDSVIDRAEIELIDLTPDELRERLAQGRIYVPEQARRALEQYFSPGNLTALRELALRRTAERVDDQMLQYMRAHGLAGPWAASDRVLVGVPAEPGVEELVRYAKRLADRLKAPWTAVHVATAGNRDPTAHDVVAQTLRLAERLGGETMILPGDVVADELLRWARANNVTQIVIGSRKRSGWRDRLGGSLPREMIRDAGDMIVHVLPAVGRAAAATRGPPREHGNMLQPWPLLAAVLLVAAATLVALPIASTIDVSNIGLVFLAPVLLAAQWFGLASGLLAAAAATLSYNFLFTEPLYTFRIDEPENVTAIIVFSIAATLTSALAARARNRTVAAREEAARAASLFAFAKKLAAVSTREDLLWAAAHQIASMLRLQVIVLSPNAGRLELEAAYPPDDRLDAKDLAAATWSWEHDAPAGRGSDNLPGAPRLFMPLRTGRERLGVVGLAGPGSGPLLAPDQRRLLDALLDQTAVALERVELARAADETRMLAETERLRSALLTSLGHDLRTPLATILGTITSLRSFGPLYDEAAREEMLAGAQGEAERLDRFLGNLLDMTRLDAGALAAKRTAVDLADVAGAALRRLGRLLGGHTVRTDFPQDLPLVRLDFVLTEQVLANLVENAVRYAPRGSTIEINAWTDAEGVILEVRDRGPGIAEDVAERIFDRFYRAPDALGTGTGLGLAVCKGFVDAMGGSIVALPRDGGGTVFRLRFPHALTVPVIEEPSPA